MSLTNDLFINNPLKFYKIGLDKSLEALETFENGDYVEISNYFTKRMKFFTKLNSNDYNAYYEEMSSEKEHYMSAKSRLRILKESVDWWKNKLFLEKQTSAIESENYDSNVRKFVWWKIICNRTIS